MAETTAPPAPSRAVSRPVSEALLNEKVSIHGDNLPVATISP
jgi:hypothetical protein